MNWNEKLQEIRDEVKWIASECLKSDEYECVHAANGICIMVADLQNKLAEHALDDAEWDRASDPSLAAGGWLDRWLLKLASGLENTAKMQELRFENERLASELQNAVTRYDICCLERSALRERLGEHPTAEQQPREQK